MASGTALARYAAARGLTGTAQDVLLRVPDDPAAAAAWRLTCAAASATLVNLSHLFCPDRIVVGGGLGLHAPGLVCSGRDDVAARGPRGLTLPIVVRTAELGDDAGLVGATAWEVTAR